MASPDMGQTVAGEGETADEQHLRRINEENRKIEQGLESEEDEEELPRQVAIGTENSIRISQLADLDPNAKAKLKASLTGRQTHISVVDFMDSVKEADAAKSQSAFLRKAVAGLMCVMVALLGGFFSMSYFAIQLSKDMQMGNNGAIMAMDGSPARVGSAEMSLSNGRLCPRDADGACTGESVKTGEVRSYASLFDLPLFDSRTLVELKALTLQLENDEELSITVTGAKKHKSGKTATIYGASGAKVVIDGQSMTAFAVLEGERHIIQNTGRRLRRLQAGAAWQPQLYEEKEFFTEENGFDIETDESGKHLRRRLSATSDHSGWAALAVSIGEAVTGFYEDSMGISVEHFAAISGDLFVTEGSQQLQFTLKMMYNTTSPRASRIYMASGSSKWLAAYGIPMEFAWTDGTLAACEPLSEPDVPGLLSNVVTLYQDGGELHATTGDDGNTMLLIVNKFEADIMWDEFQVPTHDECRSNGRRLQVQPQPDDVEPKPVWEEINGSWTGRRLTSVGYSQGWTISQFAYGFGSRPVLPTGWEFVDECTASTNWFSGKSAVAKIVRNGNTYAITFAGSDDTADWLDNIRGGLQSSIDGFHAGFHAYSEALAPCLRKKLGKTKVNYLMGHSMGGAAANIFHCLNSDVLASGVQVLTWGAPVSGPSGCHVPGQRWLHVNDGVGSNLLGMMTRFEHQTQGGRFYKEWSRRRRWSFWSRRRRSDWKWSDDCGARSDDVSLAFWNFIQSVLMYHTEYGNSGRMPIDR